LNQPSKPQLEQWIREQATNSANVFFTKHARQRMRQRGITDVMTLEVLRLGVLRREPEPSMRHVGVTCRMERLVCGVQLAVVVYVEHPAPGLTVVTVIDI